MQVQKQQDAQRKYNRAPIVHRAATVWGQISEEQFLAEFESWREQVQAEYPHYEPHKEWLVMVTEEDGVPLYDTLQPELRITHRFTRKTESGKREFGLRCPTDALAFHLFTHPGASHGYTSLSKEIQHWMPRWMRHFSVPQVTKLHLYYANLLNPDTAKPFLSSDGGLEMQRLLTTFLTVPGQHESLVPPYDCTAAVLLNKAPKMTLTLRIYGDTAVQLQPAVRVDFGVEVVPEKKEGLDVDQTLRLFDSAHERILDRFELMFTEEAKNFFSGE